MLRIVIAELNGREVGRMPIDLHRSYAANGALKDEEFFAVARWAMRGAPFTRSVLASLTYKFLES
jgi:hypothetical protein